MESKTEPLLYHVKLADLAHSPLRLLRKLRPKLRGLPAMLLRQPVELVVVDVPHLRTLLAVVVAAALLLLPVAALPSLLLALPPLALPTAAAPLTH